LEQKQYTREESASLRDINLSLKGTVPVKKKYNPQQFKDSLKAEEPQKPEAPYDKRRTNVKFFIIDGINSRFFASDWVIWPPRTGEIYVFSDKEYHAVKVLRQTGSPGDWDTYIVLLNYPNTK
jgi:hypothetical protein